MALHRENGKEQPFIPAGPFKIRIPFIHYRWEISECLQAILMCATCLGAIPVLQELLGVPYEVAWSMVIINGFFYNLHSLLGDPVVPGWITPAIPLVTAFLTLTEQGPERVQTMIALQLVVGLIFLFMGITGLASKIIGAIPNAIKSGILLGAGFSAIMGEFKAGGRAGLYPVTVLVGSIFAYFLLFSLLFKKMKAKNKLWYMIGNFGMLPAVIVAVIVGPLSGELPAPNLVLGSIIKIPDFAIIWNTLSPFAIGFPSIGKIISVIPTAIAVYIIAFGDFVSSEQLIRSAEEVRTDEHRLQREPFQHHQRDQKHHSGVYLPVSEPLRSALGSRYCCCIRTLQGWQKSNGFHFQRSRYLPLVHLYLCCPCSGCIFCTADPSGSFVSDSYRAGLCLLPDRA